MLCYRCEHRVQYLETMKNDHPRRPRYECGEIESSVCGCYMYEPIHPVVMIVDSRDNRPPWGPWMIAARMHCVRKAEMDEIQFHVEKVADGEMGLWIPKNE